jgi:hypothetical protein
MIWFLFYYIIHNACICNCGDIQLVLHWHNNRIHIDMCMYCVYCYIFQSFSKWWHQEVNKHPLSNGDLLRALSPPQCTKPCIIEPSSVQYTVNILYSICLLVGANIQQNFNICHTSASQMHRCVHKLGQNVSHSIPAQRITFHNVGIYLYSYNHTI